MHHLCAPEGTRDDPAGGTGSSPSAALVWIWISGNLVHPLLPGQVSDDRAVELKQLALGRGCLAETLRQIA